MRMTAFFSCLSLFAVLACGSPQDEMSDPSWAHSTTSRATGTIPALIAYKELGFRTDYNKIRVCLQESPSYRGAHLMLESKLAFAAWMEAGGRGSAAQWGLFDFEIENHCDMDDSNYAVAVVIASRSKPDPSQSNDFTVIECGQRNCYPNAYTTGWGGPAALSYTYGDKSGSTWSDISMYQPSVARLSPYISWEPLETEFRYVLRDSKNGNPNVEGLLNSYLSLKSKAETVSYAELVAFNKKLASLKVDSKARYGIVSSRLGSDGSTYQLQSPAFHTLLHEVGHQFGMMHAHVKAGYTDNGNVKGVPGSVKDGFYTTDAATMAYNNSFFYLTADDRAGIQDLTSKLYPYLSNRRATRR